jgi:hypothetical protein
MERKISKTTKTKTKASKRRVAKKKAQPKVESLNYADGKASDETNPAQDIEELLGHQPANPFNTMEMKSFEDDLSEMNLSQMQELAVNASIFPSGNKSGLKNKLLKEFKARFGSQGAPRFQSSMEKPIVDPKSDVAREVQRILNS